jgi:hypothetical protein
MMDRSMFWKKTPTRLRRWLSLSDWHSHYEVLVTRNQIEYLVGRVSSPAAVERLIRHTCREVELSQQTFRWQRVRGTHPWKVAQLCTWLLLCMPLVPWGWLGGGLSVLCLAVICGLLSSGRAWIRGGVDDR